MSEQENFLKSLEGEQESILDRNLEIESPDGKEPEDVEQTEQKLKNRRERRMAAQNQQIREENIALNERVKVLSEVGKFREEVGDDSLKEVEAIFGTDTPEKLQATNILKKALSGMSESAVEKALDKIEQQRSGESQALIQEEKNLDTILDSVEDDYGIDMSNDSNRKGFLTLLERLSPKDKNGDIIEYADADTTAEVYLSRKERSSGRAKDLASRSMTRSGESQPSKLEASSNEKYLKSLGVI